MGLVLGMASSHAPSMFLPPEQWSQFYRLLIRGLPQPPQAAEETSEVIGGYAHRIMRDFEVLATQLKASQAEALVIVGDDQGEVFSDACMPNLAIFDGEVMSGTTNIEALGQSVEENHIRLSGSPQIAGKILEGLVEAGFDPAVMHRLVATGKPGGGLDHAFTRPARSLGVPELGIPVIPIFLNAYHPPLISARRCLELGAALRRILDTLPQRVALYGSGGLSHDPRGPRAGWVDEPLDRWVLDRIRQGDHQALSHLFTVDSDTMRSGTGEIRSWIVVAGAYANTPATIVDYFVAHHAVTGIGFAYWNQN